MKFTVPSISMSHTSIKQVLPIIITASSILYVSYFVFSLKWIDHVDITDDSDGKKKRHSRALLHDKFSMDKIPGDDGEPDVIVIGSGMSGLSCAAVLSRLGKKVLVLEQHNDVVGGGTHTFDINGYRFDSGLHYTVPWSVPIFALTTGKRVEDVCQFKLMGEGDGTIDKIYLVNDTNETINTTTSATSATTAEPFLMKYHEAHMDELYRQFPGEKDAIDKYITISNNAMAYVKVFIALRLLPQWMQDICWKYLIPKSITQPAATTAKELLPTLTSNKRLISLLSSMWIDTGARPDRASFMLTASVFRGISIEGGCYPSGGSDVLAKELVPIILNNGGRVLIRAEVDEIIVEGGKAVGVRMKHDKNNVIKCKDGVVSSAGYANTFQRLIKEAVAAKYNIPTQLQVQQSAGFVMCNIGINASPSDIGVTNTNTWHIPVDKHDDAFPPLHAYFNNPLDESVVAPAFITFPSMKDDSWSAMHPDKVTCQMLLMAEYDWFSEHRISDKERTVAYDVIKEKWKKKCLDIFLLYYPKAIDRIEVLDVSTPLSIEYYLSSVHGGAVGLDVTPERFSDANIRRHLDPVTAIKGLYLTGQDTILCGVTLCQLSGVITAMRMSGLLSSLKILLKSVLKGFE